MTYSVWNPQTGRYAYYEVGGPGRIGAVPTPGHLRQKPQSRIGLAADDARWPLPKGAVYTGQGAEPRGRIAEGPQALGDAPDTKKATTIILVGGLVLLGLNILLAGKK